MCSSQQNHTETVPVVGFWLGSWRVSLDRRAFKTDTLRTYYDQLAESWSGIIGRLGYREAYRDCFKSLPDLTDKLQSQDTMSVLECGIGAGDLSLALADVVDCQIEVSGVDISTKMCEVAKNRLGAIEIKNKIIDADAHKLPFHDNTFDLVMCAHLLEHSPQPIEILAEMHRVVKPGGQIIVCITRRSMFGLWIHLRWRAQMLSSQVASDLLTSARFESVEEIDISKGMIFKNMSFALRARKVRQSAGIHRVQSVHLHCTPAIK